MPHLRPWRKVTRNRKNIWHWIFVEVCVENTLCMTSVWSLILFHHDLVRSGRRAGLGLRRVKQAMLISRSQPTNKIHQMHLWMSTTRLLWPLEVFACFCWTETECCPCCEWCPSVSGEIVKNSLSVRFLFLLDIFIFEDSPPRHFLSDSKFEKEMKRKRSWTPRSLNKLAIVQVTCSRNACLVHPMHACTREYPKHFESDRWRVSNCLPYVGVRRRLEQAEKFHWVTKRFTCHHLKMKIKSFSTLFECFSSSVCSVQKCLFIAW